MIMSNKKEKITYIDDGRTLADMSGVGGTRLRDSNPYRPKLEFKEVWKTYWSAVKMMFKPMLVVIGALILVYAIMYVVLLLSY